MKYELGWINKLNKVEKKLKKSNMFFTENYGMEEKYLQGIN